MLITIGKVKNQKEITTIRRAYAGVIDGQSADGFLHFFQKHISQNAHIESDQWAGYSPLKEEFPLFVLKKSDKGKNFPEMHIINIKGWLRGIHHHCSKQHFENYLYGFFYCFNGVEETSERTY